MSNIPKPPKPCAAYYLATVLSIVNLLGILAVAAITIGILFAPHILSKLTLKPAAKAQEETPAAAPEPGQSGFELENTQAPSDFSAIQEEGGSGEGEQSPDLDSLLHSLQDQMGQQGEEGQGGQGGLPGQFYQMLAPKPQTISFLTPLLFVPFGVLAIIVGLYVQVFLAVARGLLLAYPPRRPRRRDVKTVPPVKAA
jgi:hypothetical protein